MKNIKFITVISLLTLFTVGAASFVEKKVTNDLQTALIHYQKEAKADNLLVAKNVESALTQIYQNIRTISYLPSIRNITPQNHLLDKDAIAVIQQIYNNLASNVAVSELYVNRVDFNHQQVDGDTGSPEKPLMMFDEIIVGRTADDHLTHQGANISGIEEVEIYEYQEIEKQLATLQSHYPTIDRFAEFSNPLISSKEVITCDNSRYSTALNNHDDRKGIVYSVPFYDMAGALQGSISAIILTKALAELLPTKDVALFNTYHNYIALPQEVSQSHQSRQWIEKGKPDPDLYFSEIIPLNTHEINGQWHLWVGHPKSILDNSQEVTAIKQFRFIAYTSIFLFLALAILLTLLFRRNYLLQKRALHEAEEANQIKSEFIANMSHELRTPMHAILNYAKLSRNKVRKGEIEDDQGKLTKYMANIIFSGERLLAMINGLLDLSQFNAGMMEITKGSNDLCKITRQVIDELEVLATDKDITIHTPQAEERLAMFDKGRIQQVIVNLLSNALKFSPESSDIYINIEQDENNLTWSIQDQGEGIPESELGIIFDPFQQSSNTRGKADSTGLGLPICKKIIEAHGGTLQVKNNIDSGATFTFTLPK